MVMGNSKNLRVFNFSNLLKSRKSDASVIYVFYSSTRFCARRSDGQISNQISVPNHKSLEKRFISLCQITNHTPNHKSL